ncbi:MAG: type VI secretion system protein ImpH [Halieaceae bacterium]|jgi:type VI secretion system protein ImpH
MTDSDPYATLFEMVAAYDDRDTVNTIGNQTTIAREPARFENEHALGYMEKATTSFKDGKLSLNTALFGLLGIVGPLPYFYSEITARSERKNEAALRDFLGIFSHRATSLMYKAWRKSQIGFERQPGADDGQQRKYARLLASLSGASFMPERIAWLDVRASGPLSAPDLFVRRVRNAKGLRHFLSRQFGMRFEVQEFVGAWEVLADDARSAIGVRHREPALGVDTLLGSRVWQAQSTIRIVVEHPSPEQYELLRPGSDSLRRIQLAIRMYCTAEVAFRLRITINGKDIKPGRPGSSKTGGAMLGWNTIAGKPDTDRNYQLSISRDYNTDRMAS